MRVCLVDVARKPINKSNVKRTSVSFKKIVIYPEAVARSCSVKRDFLKYFVKFTRMQLCRCCEHAGSLQAYLKETPAQVFSCNFRKIFKNTYEIISRQNRQDITIEGQIGKDNRAVIQHCISFSIPYIFFINIV